MQTPKSIRELQRVVNGRKWWYFSEFTLPEQLAAIESLGRTRSHEALTFLELLYTATVPTESESSVILASGASGASSVVESRAEMHRYPSASGFLRAELDFAVDLGDSFLPSWRAEADIEADRKRFRDRESYRIMRTAIATLKADLGVDEWLSLPRWSTLPAWPLMARFPQKLILRQSRTTVRSKLPFLSVCYATPYVECNFHQFVAVNFDRNVADMHIVA